MIEVTGNLWSYRGLLHPPPADVRVITTNGTVRRDGRCVMGRGCAKEALEMFRTADVARRLGRMIEAEGNNVYDLGSFELPTTGAFRLLSFPVKHHFAETADPNLIAMSAYQLAERFNAKPDVTIVMPQPGCGNGGLHWSDVKPILAPILDDRFHVIHFGGPV